MMDVTEMIKRHAYDTESANMMFMEEDIDWQVMNIKMTIDKSGKQHPTWLYNALYIKDEDIHVHNTSNWVDRIIVEANTIHAPPSPPQPIKKPFYINDDDIHVYKANHWDDQIIVEANPIHAPPSPPQPIKKQEYETITVNDEFDVEMGEWKENESFRLTFDPKGKICPVIELLSRNDVVDPGPEHCEPDTPNLSLPNPDQISTNSNTDTISTHSNHDPIPEPIETNPTPDPMLTHPNSYSAITVPTPDPSTTKETRQPEQSYICNGQTNCQEEIFAGLSLSTICTFILPDIRQFGKHLGIFMKDELIDIHMLQMLTTNGGINWWSDIRGCCKLFPLWTLQNQTSLLSAVNFILYGFNNHVISLQKHLHSVLLDPVINQSLKQRWHYTLWTEQLQTGKSMYTSAELENKWRRVTKGSWFDYLTNPAGCETYPSNKFHIEPIHIYMIANILCRPIIILSEVNEIEGLPSKIDPSKTLLNGVYLPFEQKSEACHKYPIILGYHNFQFSALVTTDKKVNTLTSNNSSVCVPVMDSYLRLLPIHFVTCPGPEWKPDENVNESPILTDEEKMEVLQNYLHLFQVRFSKKSYDWMVNYQNKELNSSQNIASNNFLVATKTDINNTPNNYEKMFKNYVHAAKKRYRKMKNKKVKCKGIGCSQIPSSQLGGVCLQCYQRTLLNHNGE